jgi:cytochrome c
MVRTLLMRGDMRTMTLLVLLLAAACSKGESGGGAPSTPESKEAADIFKNRCTPCHGATGHGDGPASASLSPHPRNFHDKTWQKSVTDEHIQKIVQYGGAAVGKSPNMPANPDLQAKPAVVAELAKKIRSFGQQ